MTKQSVAAYEHIVIDGNSTDGTKEYLNSISASNIILKSESDKGIYDAMNKGIKLVKGNWVVFMNAGDTFANKEVLTKFIGQSFNSDIVYGNCSIDYENGLNRLSKPNRLEQLWKGMSFSHQTVFIKNELLQKNTFDLGYNYCADFNQFFGLYLNGSQFHYWDFTIANIEAGGVSDSRRYVSTNEVYKINRKLDPKLKNHIYFIPKIIWGFAVVKIKSILPKKLVKKLIQFKYK